MINRNFKDFKFQHKRNRNQILFTSKKIDDDFEIINLINNFLKDKNSFIFESVEKGIIKGRYTIFGRNPDKIWEFNNKNSYLIKGKKKFKLKDKPDQLIEKIIEEFKFETPKNLPKICSLISGYFFIVPGVNHQPSPRPVIGALLAIINLFSATAFFSGV